MDSIQGLSNCGRFRYDYSSHDSVIGDAYIHELLDMRNSHIRVIYIQPGDDASSISCTIRQMPLQGLTQGTFTSLSHAWGPLPADRIIFVEQRPFPIRENLWRCLWYFRKKLSFFKHCTGGPAHQSEPMWIDAISIDQHSPLERNHQVQMMADIYSGATVQAWLGSTDPLLQEIIQTTDLTHFQPGFRGIRSFHNHVLDGWNS